MNAFILAGIGFYMVVMLIIGFWSSRKIHNLADFLVAGRRLPFPLALATLFATWFGAGTCMGASGTAYTDGILGVIADPFAAGVALVIAGFFYVHLLRRLNLLTVTDIFGKYYDKNSEIFASFLMVPVYVGWLGSQIVALGYIINVLTGLDPLLGMIVSTAVLLIYTYEGGMWAVTLTDFVQLLFLIAGLMVLLPAVLSHIGGFGELVKSTPAEMWRFYPHGGGARDWVSYFGQWGLLGLGTVVGQDLVQRSLSSKNEKVARDSAFWAGIGYLTIGLIPVLLGLAGRLIMPDLQDPEMILPSLAMEFLPTVGIILFLGALISAIMSSADSSLLAASSLITNNILYRFFPATPEARVLKWAKIATVLVAVLSMLVALYVKQIYDLMVNSWATLFVGILVPVTAALYWKKANREAAWASMITGCAVWLGLILIRGTDFGEISDAVFYEAAFYGGCASLLAYLGVTFLRYGKITDIQPASAQPS